MVETEMRIQNNHMLTSSKQVRLNNTVKKLERNYNQVKSPYQITMLTCTMFCQIIMSNCQIMMSTCQIFMLTHQIVFLLVQNLKYYSCNSKIFSLIMKAQTILIYRGYSTA